MQYLRVASVVVLGSLNMDLVVRVPQLPRPGETVLGDRVLTIQGGKGGNQAVAAARLGAYVRMIGRVGGDAYGPQLIAGLQLDGVDTVDVALGGDEPSGVALIVVDGSGENQITVAPGANAAVGDKEIEALVRGLGPDDVVVLQLEIPMATVLSAIDAAHQAGARVILNAAPSGAIRGRRIPSVDLLIVNKNEANDLGGPELRAATGAMAMTLGAAGSVIYEGDRETRTEPWVVKAVDSTAAGDAFVGATAFALTRGLGLADAVRLGGAAGAAAVTKMGARPSLPRPEDLARLFGIDIADFPSRPQK
jgi:ribokinase